MRHAPFDSHLFPAPPDPRAATAYATAQRPDLAHVSADGPPGAQGGTT